MDWWEKVTVQNCGRALVKSKNQPGRVVLAPWRLKWSTIYTVDIWATKTSSNTGYSQPRHLPVPEATIWAFHITVNSPPLQLASGWKLVAQWCGYMLVVLVWCAIWNGFPRLGHIYSCWSGVSGFKITTCSNIIINKKIKTIQTVQFWNASLNVLRSSFIATYIME